MNFLKSVRIQKCLFLIEINFKKIIIFFFIRHFPDEQIRLQTGSTESEYKLLCSIFVNGHLQGRNYGTK